MGGSSRTAARPRQRLGAMLAGAGELCVEGRGDGACGSTAGDGYVGVERCRAELWGRLGRRRQGPAFGARDGAARGMQLAWCGGGRAAVMQRSVTLR